MKKLGLLLLLIMTLSLFGQSPRLTGMGNVNGYIQDDSDIFTYPATINLYSNTVYGYLGSSSEYDEDYSFGLNYEIPQGILGVYLNTPLPSSAYLYNIVFEDGVTLDHNFQAFFGFENLGFSLMY